MGLSARPRAPAGVREIDFAALIESNPFLLEQLPLGVGPEPTPIDAPAGRAHDSLPRHSVERRATQNTQRHPDGTGVMGPTEHGRNLAVRHHLSLRYARHEPVHQTVERRWFVTAAFGRLWVRRPDATVRQALVARIADRSVRPASHPDSCSMAAASRAISLVTLGRPRTRSYHSRSRTCASPSEEPRFVANVTVKR